MCVCYTGKICSYHNKIDINQLLLIKVFGYIHIGKMLCLFQLSVSPVIKSIRNNLFGGCQYYLCNQTEYNINV